MRVLVLLCILSILAITKAQKPERLCHVVKFKTDHIVSQRDRTGAFVPHSAGWDCCLNVSLGMIPRFNHPKVTNFTTCQKVQMAPSGMIFLPLVFFSLVSFVGLLVDL